MAYCDGEQMSEQIAGIVNNKCVNAEIFIHSSEPLSAHQFLSLDRKQAISPKEKVKPFWANDWRKKHKR